MSTNLFFVIILILFFIVDVEVSKFVAVLGVGNNSEPITEVVLLQIFLGKIFQVPLGESNF